METRNYEDVAAEKPLFGEATRKVYSYHFPINVLQTTFILGLGL